MKIAFLYEHPEWSAALIKCLQNNEFDVTPICVSGLQFDPDDLAGQFDLAVNRINIMPSADAARATTFQAQHLLACFEAAGTRVLNGLHTHIIGLSKATQNALFSRLGLPHPKGIAIHRIQDALTAAESIGFPLIFKPNVGGSGQGIQKFDNPEELALAVETKSLDFGVDGTGIIQQYVESDGYVYRVEILGNALFYSIRQPIQSDSFNYCAADGCSAAGEPAPEEDNLDFCVVTGAGSIEVFDVPAPVLEQVKSIIGAANADIGGVEYLIDQNTGEACFYDFNPYSNFVSNGESLLGFSPEQRFADFLQDFRSDGHGK